MHDALSVQRVPRPDGPSRHDHAPRPATAALPCAQGRSPPTAQRCSSMAGPAQGQKRQRADENSSDDPSPKRVKVNKATSRERPNFSPAFWDSLSKVWLTPRALRELDRRNGIGPNSTTRLPELNTKDLARFARHGGPDTSRLRGHPNSQEVRNMSSNHSSPSHSRRTQSTKATSVSSKPSKSSAYDNDFEQYLIDHDIYPDGYEYSEGRSTPEPSDIDGIRQQLADPRPSLSPSQFPSSAFKDVKRKNNTRSEGSIMRNVIPVIAGTANIPTEGNLPFTNLTSITDETTVKAVPDFFDGARLSQVDRTVREDLSQMIIPTKHADVPVLPNFFLETKAPSGGADVAKRQACYDGAHGARAMHALQNYGRDEPEYDGNAYAFSSTYHDGTLKMYAHHLTAPTATARPGYHMTQADTYAMTGNREKFVEGATAFRNARDLAKRHRDSFIEAANSRSQTQTEVPLESLEEPSEDSTADEFVDCEDHLTPRAPLAQVTDTGVTLSNEPLTHASFCVPLLCREPKIM